MKSQRVVSEHFVSTDYPSGTKAGECYSTIQSYNHLPTYSVLPLFSPLSGPFKTPNSPLILERSIVPLFRVRSVFIVMRFRKLVLSSPYNPFLTESVFLVLPFPFRHSTSPYPGPLRDTLDSSNFEIGDLFPLS